MIVQTNRKTLAALMQLGGHYSGAAASVRKCQDATLPSLTHADMFAPLSPSNDRTTLPHQAKL